jgi:hypothetical protein
VEIHFPVKEIGNRRRKQTLMSKLATILRISAIPVCIKARLQGILQGGAVSDRMTW